jgi:hypothetical protein
MKNENTVMRIALTILIFKLGKKDGVKLKRITGWL